MYNGFISVAVVTPNIRVADVRYNTEVCIKYAENASAHGAKVVLFPELALTGASCADLFFNESLISASLDGLKKFAYASSMTDSIYVIGVPIACGDKLYSCAAVVQGGQVLGIVPKSNLRAEQLRWFSPCPELNLSYTMDDSTVMLGSKQIFVCSNMPSLKLGIEFYEDLCCSSPVSGEVARAGASMLLCLGAEKETGLSHSKLDMLCMSQSKRMICGYVLASSNINDSTTDGVYGGYSVSCENGSLIAKKQAFDEDVMYTEIDVNMLTAERRRSELFKQKTAAEYCEIEFYMEYEHTDIKRVIPTDPFLPETDEERASMYERIISIQAHALAKRVMSSYAKKLVVGVSGGLDSTLALLVCSYTLKLLDRPATDIISVTMPCFGTSERTKDNAYTICNELGTDFRCINIADAVTGHLNDIGHDISLHDVVFENSQARERTQVLLDIANAEGGIVVGTGDLSELVLGWATYNGDHMSSYSVNCSVPKTLVRNIVEYCGRIAGERGKDALASALSDIAYTPISPELLPTDNGNIAQKTEDIVGPYEIHDFYIYYMLKYGFSPSKLYRLAKHALGKKYSDETLLKWLEVLVRRFFSQQFKRSCLPDGPVACDISISPRGGLCMPSDASSALWLEEIQQLKEQ